MNPDGPSRRELLRSSGLLLSGIISGCQKNSSRKTYDNSSDKSATVISSTRRDVSSEKPSKGFQPTQFTGTPQWSDVPSFGLGAGDLEVFIFSDYSQRESYEFWTRTWDIIRHYAVNDRISAYLRHLPAPVDKWSMFLPCALFELGVQLGWRKHQRIHLRLYDELYPDYTIRDIEVMAGAMGADVEKVIQAGKRRKRRAHLEKHAAVGSLFDVSEPFAITIDGDPIRTPDYEVIDREIRKRLDD